MIVSHRHGFIFLKTRKTAGTSVEAFLARNCAPQDIVTPLVPPVRGHRPRNHRGRVAPWKDAAGPIPFFEVLRRWWRREAFWNHMPASMVQSRVGKDVWNRSTVVCIERNPWDRIASEYRWRRKQGHLEAGLSFRDFVLQDHFTQNWRIYTIDGTVVVDRLLRFEALEKDLAELSMDLGLPAEVDLPHEKRTKGSGVQVEERYDDAMIDRVIARCAPEFDAGAYSRVPPDGRRR